MSNFNLGPTTHALGTFPVTQQVVGALFAVGGIVFTITNLVSLIFNQMRKKAAGNADADLDYEIERLQGQTLHCFKVFLWAVVTIVPVVSTITNSVFWYKGTHPVYV